jgi:radical SAM superfamily enzyme YgiQ (UPF0313 family)
MLASMGCPYTCNFCADWNNSYRALSSERLQTDLKFASEKLPGIRLIFYDPNFGIRFDETLDNFESVEPGRRSPYAIESSLTNVRTAERLERLRETNCIAVAPGIESWSDYSNKAGVGKAAARAKMEHIVKHLETVNEYVPFIQTNFIFGLDSDSGDEPFELTKEFLLRVPFATPTLNIPMAFGGTPLFDTLLKEGRLLPKLPFNFYVIPYLTVILKNYDPIEYFTKMIDMYAVLYSRQMIQARRKAKSPWQAKTLHYIRTVGFYTLSRAMQSMLDRLKHDRQFYAFHTGKSDVLPEFYVHEYQEQLGKYAELMPASENQPVLDQDFRMLQPVIFGR